ncbi:MAG: tRNA pseudouridine(38-40) synthase TruA [Acidimicrobiales bacterium]
MSDQVRVFMRIAYDGRDFHGFASQPGVRTVAGTLIDALGAMSCECAGMVCAGRTDAGVHARGQVVHVDIDLDRDIDGEAGKGGVFSPGSLARSLNRMLAPEIVVRQCGIAPPGFDARHSATARSYRYIILNSALPDPLMVHRVWHVKDSLDVRAMRMAADCILGTHDFSAFCRRRKGDNPGTPIIRKVLRSEVSASPLDSEEEGKILRFDISAGSFCHQMVRSLVGTFVEVGRGRRTPADVYCLLQSPAGSRVSILAPAEGLCLMQVDYDGCEIYGK